MELPWSFESEEATDYDVGAEWPDHAAAKRIGAKALYRVPLRNPELGTVFGVLAALFGLAARSGARGAFDQAAAADEPMEVLEPFTAGPFWQDQLQVLWGAAHNIGAWAIVAALALALFAMAKAHRRAWYVATLAAAFHLALHGVAATGAVVAAARLTEAVPATDSPIARILWADSILASWPTAGFAILTGLIGAGFGLLAFALYLVIMQFFRVNLNELFVGMRLTEYKHFLRLQVRDDAITGTIVGFSSIPDLDLRWVDGRPVVEGDRAAPILVDQFTVAADAGAHIHAHVDADIDVGGVGARSG